MNRLKKYGDYLMILAIISELFMPFIFAHFYPDYNQISMLISDFGEDGSPTQTAFKVWAITDGLLFLLAVPAIYERFKPTSEVLAKWLGITIALFGIGDCLITGLFDTTTQANSRSIESMIHDYASGAGFAALLIGTFLLIKLYSMEKNQFMQTVLPLIFVISAIAMILFAAPRIPFIAKLHMPYRGLWQRINLLFLYLPFLLNAVLSIYHLSKQKNRQLKND